MKEVCSSSSSSQWVVSSSRSSTVINLLAVLKECSGSRDLARGVKAHSQAIICGLSSDTYVVTSLINMYAKCGSMVEARKLFDTLPHRNVISWTSLLWGYVQNGESEVALDLFEVMNRSGCSANARTYVAAISACGSLALKEDDGKKKLDWLSKGQDIHSQAVRNRCCDVFVGNAVVNMYAKMNKMVVARSVFDKMVVRDVVSWNALLQGYVDNGESELALELVDVMQTTSQCCKGNARTYVAAISACGNLASEEEEKSSERCKRWLEKGKDLHEQAVANKCCSVFVETTLVDTYAKCGEMRLARRVFDGMKQRNVVTWTALVTGYVENGENEVALKMVALMDLSGVGLNSLSFVIALEACGNLMAVTIGEGFHAEIIHSCGGRDEDQDLAVWNSLVGFYGRCGCLEAAEMVFDSIVRKSVVSWTAMMCGYALQGAAGRVFEVFEEMRRSNLRPNGVTFLCLLSACSHAGLTSKGKEFFETMQASYGVVPTIKHYNCMVDLLGRANLIEEALSFVEAMAIEPNAVTWKTVLSACVKWNDVRVGRLAYERLMGMDDSSSCVLMANIYRGANNLATQHHQGGNQTLWTHEARIVHKFVTM